jgi:hypothetical protein
MVIIDGSANGHNIQEARREESAQDFYIHAADGAHLLFFSES